MNKKAFALCICLMLAACSMMDEEPEVKPSDSIVQAGMPLPTFAVTMHDGTVLSSSDLRGKPSLIVFFSTTCPDCQRELPLLEQRYAEHGTDTTFVAIGREESDEVVTAYWQAHGLTLPYSAQPDRHVYALFARQGIPRIYITNAQGIVSRCEP